MTIQDQLPNAAQRRDEWVDRVRRLVEQVAGWAQGQGWKADHDTKQVREELLGAYTVPTLRVRPPGGELALEPVGAHIAGGDGRVDLEAYPTLNRVKLIGETGGGWRIITDSNVPLREPWDEQTFAQLAKDLLA